jgi:hypothetical protein
MKAKAQKSSADRYKDAIERAINSKIERLEARAKTHGGGNGELAEERTAAVRVNRMRGEMLLAKARGELITKDLVEKQAAYLLIAMRQRILSIPSTYARRLVGITDQKQMAHELKAMALSVLNEPKDLPSRVTDPNWLEKLENGDGEQA